MNGFLGFQNAIKEAMKWEDSTIDKDSEVLWNYKDDASTYNVYYGNIIII